MQIADHIRTRIQGITDEDAAGAEPCVGLRRMGAPPSAGMPVFIVAGSLLDAEETARGMGLGPAQWRAVCSREDLAWHGVPGGARVVEAAGGCPWELWDRMADRVFA